MSQSDALDDWIRLKVSALLLDEDVYTEYVKGMLQDEDSDISARVQNACDFLYSASTGVLSEEEQKKLLDAGEMEAKVKEIVADTQKLLEKKEASRIAEIELHQIRLYEQEKRAAKVACAKEQEELHARQKMSVNPTNFLNDPNRSVLGILMSLLEEISWYASTDLALRQSSMRMEISPRLMKRSY